ncbi:hypothetical protein, partial [Treponema sp. R8-4-B8]
MAIKLIKILFLTFLVLFVFIMCLQRNGTEKKGDEILEINIKYLKHFDLVFHVLAYLKVDNASNLYSDEYIEKMAIEKQNFAYDIIPHINSLKDYYNNNFNRLSLINFLPFYSKDFNDLKNIYRNCNSFTTDDMKHFINPFIDILESESSFYFNYWESIHKDNKYIRKTVEEEFKHDLKKYSCMFEHYNKKPFVIFSYSLTNNGRGFGTDTLFSAVIRFPRNEKEVACSFIQLLHEYTHKFTDNLLGTNINMEEGSNDLAAY